MSMQDSYKEKSPARMNTKKRNPTITNPMYITPIIAPAYMMSVSRQTTIIRRHRTTISNSAELTSIIHSVRRSRLPVSRKPKTDRQHRILSTTILQNSYLHGHECSLYAEDNFNIGNKLSFNAGVHLSLFYTQGKGISPPNPACQPVTVSPMIGR